MSICEFHHSKIEKNFSHKVQKLSKANFSHFDRTRGDKYQTFRTLDLAHENVLGSWRISFPSTKFRPKKWENFQQVLLKFFCRNGRSFFQIVLQELKKYVSCFIPTNSELWKTYIRFFFLLDLELTMYRRLPSKTFSYGQMIWSTFGFLEFTKI